ncbi:hypothetical protein [uncultured Tessaracoccus sp.]|uniref:hypothetical protein n=1 Tax=uncultured Tessaracoccus sp. TaxID=905023 RepID=UPI00262A48E3|nr:hypothetical protein [uncultured Tessaracoccus sp.]
MVKQRRLGFVVISSLLLISVAACQSSQAATEEQPTPSAPTSIRSVPSAKSSSPSPSPSSSSSSEWVTFPPPEPDESAEITAIRQAWESHELMFDKFARDPKLKDMNELTKHASGDVAFSIVHSIGLLRDRRLVRVGSLKYSDVEIELSNSEKADPRTAMLSVCKDSSGISYVTEKDGKTPPSEDALDVLPKLRMTWILEQLPDKIWRVTSSDGEQGC